MRNDPGMNSQISASAVHCQHHMFAGVGRKGGIKEERRKKKESSFFVPAFLALQSLPLNEWYVAESTRVCNHVRIVLTGLVCSIIILFHFTFSPKRSC